MATAIVASTSGSASACTCQPPVNGSLSSASETAATRATRPTSAAAVARPQVRGIHCGTGSSQPRFTSHHPDGEERRHLRPLPQVEVERAVGRERPEQTHRERPDHDGSPGDGEVAAPECCRRARMVGRCARRRRRRRRRAARPRTTAAPCRASRSSLMNKEPTSAAAGSPLGLRPDHTGQRTNEERVDDQRDSQAPDPAAEELPAPRGRANVERGALRAGTGPPSRTVRQEGSPPPPPPRWQRSRCAPGSTSRHRARRRWRRGGR